MTFQRLPFLDVLKDASGGNVKTPHREFLEEGEIPVVDQGQGLIAGFVNDKSRVCNAELPVIVFGDHTRALKYVDFAFAMGADGTKVLVSKGESDMKYLYHALSAIEIPASGYSRHYKFLKRTLIPLPPLAEQKRIAKILDAADALRTKRRESIAQLDTLLQSTFLDMFGDPVTNPSTSLEEVCELITDGTHQTPTYADEGVKFLSAKNVKTGEINWEDIKFIPESLHKELHKRLSPQPNDILLAKNGTTGTAAIVDRIEVFDIYVSLALLRPKDSVSSLFLLHAINSDHAGFQFARSLKGVGVPNLHLKEIRKTRIPFPSLDHQNRFAAIVESFGQQKATQRAHLAELDTLFAALQQRAFNGTL